VLDGIRGVGMMVGGPLLLLIAALAAVRSALRALFRGRLPSAPALLGTGALLAYAGAVRQWMKTWGAPPGEGSTAAPVHGIEIDASALSVDGAWIEWRVGAGALSRWDESSRTAILLDEEDMRTRLTDANGGAVIWSPPLEGFSECAVEVGLYDPDDPDTPIYRDAARIVKNGLSYSITE
jgi:hypothetical protein